jgi:hypothetical protein
MEYERLVGDAAKLLEEAKPNRKKIDDMYAKLVAALDPRDEFLFNWRTICRKKGWLK